MFASERVAIYAAMRQALMRRYKRIASGEVPRPDVLFIDGGKGQLNQALDVLAELEMLIERSIKKRAVGEFTLPGLMKITTVKKPAVKARKGINPFTGEETMFKAKPASVAVKVRPLKKMKEFAQS